MRVVLPGDANSAVQLDHLARHPGQRLRAVDLGRGRAQVLELLQYLDEKAGIKIGHSVVLTRVNSMVTTRALQLVKALSTIGRPGHQVAVITRRPTGYFIAQESRIIRADDAFCSRHRLTGNVTAQAAKCQECLELPAQFCV